MPRGKSGKAILPTVDEVQSKEKSKVEEAIEKVKRKKVVKEESDDEEEVVKEVVKEVIEPEKKVEAPKPVEQPPAPAPVVEKPKRVYARKPKAEPKPRIYEEEEDDDEPEFIIQRARPVVRQEPQFDPSIFTKQFEETQTKIQKFNEQLEELKKQNQRQRLFDYRDGLTVLKNHSHQMKIKF